MKRNARIILFLCILSVSGFIALQSAWLFNYYRVSKDQFEKDIDLAFEDAVKKEFLLRCDTLERLMYNFLTDTTQIRISSREHPTEKVFIYTVINKNNPADKYEFGLHNFNQPIVRQNDSAYQHVAMRAAQQYRTEHLEQHIIYYNTQNIGTYIGNAAREFSFDTGRLRPLFAQCLALRKIEEPFVFRFSDKDSLLNNSSFPDSISSQYPFISKAFSTFLNEPGRNYVRAMFRSNSSYLLGKLGWMLAAAVILLLVIAFSLYYLFRSLRREKRLSLIKNDFISNISHELKTPVATVSGAVDALTSFDALQSPEKTRRYLAVSRIELDRLSGMIDQILYSSIYESGDLPLKKEPIAIDELVQQVIEHRQTNLPKEVTFVYHNHVSTLTVNADRMHLTNCIHNLVDNSIKYSGDPVKIVIDARKINEQLVIAVTDNGKGISEKYLPFIFEKFFRVPQGNFHPVKGYGLGLSYVKSIIERHNGYCSVSSDPKSGTTFSIFLPL